MAVCASVKGRVAFQELVPCGESVQGARMGRASQALGVYGTACRDFLRSLPRMEMALAVMFVVLAMA